MRTRMKKTTTCETVLEVKNLAPLENIMKWILLVKYLMVFGLQDGPKVDISSENVSPNAKKSIWSYVFRENSTFWAILEANIAYTYAENANLQTVLEVKYFAPLGNFMKWSLFMETEYFWPPRWSQSDHFL